MRPALNPEQAAELIGTSRQGVYRLIHAGALKAKRIGRTWRIRPEWVEAFMEDESARTAPMPVSDRRRLRDHQALN